MTRISRRQFLKWSLIGGASLMLPSSALAANAVPGDGASGLADITFIDHYNLRGYSEGESATRQQLAQLKLNLEQAAALGVTHYVLFMGDTFEGLLTYDFDMDGVGRVGQVFREGGSDRARAAFLRDMLRQAVDYATARGVKLIVNTNQFQIAKPVYRLLSERLAGTAGAPVCPGREDTWRLYRGKLGEFLGLFPEVVGLQVTADEAERRRVSPSAQAARRDGEQRGLRQRVEGKCEQGADQRDRSRSRSAREASEQPPAQPDRMNDATRGRAQHGIEIRQAERREKPDRDPGAGVVEPAGYRPALGHEAHRERHCGHHRAVTERKEQPTPAGESPVGLAVVAGEPVDGHQVIGVDPVARPEDEYERGERRPVVRQVLQSRSGPHGYAPGVALDFEDV